MNKVKCEIESILVNKATFATAPYTLEPTLINFFYGKNGTCKSTIAKAFDDSSVITWKAGTNTTDYKVMVFNEDYIKKNFENLGNLPGVFSISEENIQAQHDITELENKNATITRQIQENRKSYQDNEQKIKTNDTSCEEACWNVGKEYKESFDKCMTGAKAKATFTAKVRATAPAHHDLDELKLLYNTLYSGDKRKYNLMAIPSLGGAPTCDLLEKAIVNSSNTPFAEFVKRLNIGTWLEDAHNKYHSQADGKCPYCQRKLEDDFDEKFKSAFDEEYKKNIESIKAFKDTYRAEMGRIYKTLNDNLNDTIPTFDLNEYKLKIQELIDGVKENIALIESKIQEPEKSVALKDLSPIIDRACEIVTEYNAKVTNNNNALNDIANKKSECTTAFWEEMAYKLADSIGVFDGAKQTMLLTRNSLKTEYEALTLNYQNNLASISTLNTKFTSIQPTIKAINVLIKSSGMQGFEIKERSDMPGRYHVVREDGSVATTLSEGEKNFITFLYFYYSVQGNELSAGNPTNKIVVIDDPISSMDSSVLFIVSGLVKNLMKIAYNNTDFENPNEPKYIKQFFLLTHNAFFYNSIVGDYTQKDRQEFVNIYYVTKKSNKSAVKLCVRNSQKAGVSIEENYSPVMNPYETMWTEFQNADNPVVIISSIRRIMQYYFFQTCGYKRNALFDKIESNKDTLITVEPDGSVDDSKYILAKAMLEHVTSNYDGLIDSEFYDEHAHDGNALKSIFKLLFTALEQEQHYNLMMNEE